MVAKVALPLDFRHDILEQAGLVWPVVLQQNDRMAGAQVTADTAKHTVAQAGQNDVDAVLYNLGSVECGEV